MRFTTKNLLQLSHLTHNQYRKLYERDLVPSPMGYAPTHSFSEIIYCRMIHHLRQEYSLQNIKTFVKPFLYYGRQLTTCNYAITAPGYCDQGYTADTTPLPVNVYLWCVDELELENNSKDEKAMMRLIAKQLESCYFHLQKKSYLRIDDPIVKHINTLYVNLNLIRKDLKERAIILNTAPEHNKRNLQLTNKQVQEICLLIKHLPYAQIAKDYNIQESVISKIAKGHSYKHITEKIPGIPTSDRRGLVYRQGEGVNNSILKEKDVLEICELIKHKTYSEIAKKYGVHITTICSIAKGRNWKSVTGRFEHIPFDKKNQTIVHPNFSA
jgi:DNA-binding CsgD family transcriptional regulator